MWLSKESLFGNVVRDDKRRLVTKPQTKNRNQTELNGCLVVFKVHEVLFHRFIVWFGTLTTARTSLVGLIITVDNPGTDDGSVRVESGKKPHRKEATHNDNVVRLLN